MRLDDEELAMIVAQELANAQGYDADSLAGQRQKALRFYLGELPEPPMDDQGNQTGAGVVSMDVAECMHATLAQTMPVLKSSLIEFPAMGEGDVAAAQMETDAVRLQLDRSGGGEVIGGAVHDAMLDGNGWLYLEIERGEDQRVKRFPPNAPVEAFAGMPKGASVERDQETGEIVVTYTKAFERLVIESVPFEEMCYSREKGVSDVQKLRLVSRRKTYTVASLRGMGIDQDLIDACPDSQDQVNDTARNEPWNDGDRRAVQEALRQKVVECAYLWLDPNLDGKTQELWHIWLGGKAVLFKEKVEYRPYVTGCLIPVPHRIQGRSLQDLLQSIQESKTQIIRDFIDNLGALNASRVGAVEGQVNMSDLTNGRINGVVRLKRPDALVPLPAADIGPQAIAGLNYMDQVRGQRVGAALDATEIQAQMMSASATAAAGQLAQVEMLSGWFAGNIANTLLKNLYLLAHRMLRDVETPLELKRAGQWTTTRPNEWPERQIAQVTMGLTTAQRTQRQMALQGVLTQQTNLLTGGFSGILTDARHFYNAMVDWLRAADLPDADQYLIDPSSPPAQQAAQQKSQQQAQQNAQQQQLVQQLQQMQQQFELEKQQRDLDYKRWSDMLNAQIEEAKVTSSSTTEALKIRDARHASERAAEAENRRTRLELVKARNDANSGIQGPDEELGESGD